MWGESLWGLLLRCFVFCSEADRQSVPCLPSAQWRLVASTPFALRPGLSRERVVRTKEITKEKREERVCRTKERTEERTPPRA